jgi:hypothetical protein
MCAKYLREEAGRGLAAAVLAPIGFLCDHIEVLYDLDVEAARVPRRQACRWCAQSPSTIIRDLPTRWRMRCSTPWPDASGRPLSIG